LGGDDSHEAPVNDNDNDNDAAALIPPSVTRRQLEHDVVNVDSGPMAAVW
jgi:hypothetical protein